MRHLVLLSSLCLFAGGCGFILDLINPPGGTDTPTDSSGLKAFASEEELRAYLVSEIDGRNDRFGRGFDTALPGVGATTNGEAVAVDLDSADGAQDAVEVPPIAVPESGSDDASGAFSQTTIQEQGVDESDVVKTDGSHLYIIDRQRLRIVQASPRSSLELLSEVELQGFGREIYLYDNKVIALTATFGNTYFASGGGGVAIELMPAQDIDLLIDSDASPDSVVTSDDAEFSFVYERPKTIVTVIDIADGANPTILSQTRFDGTASSSRMIDGVLHLVLSNFQEYYFDVLPLLGRPELDLTNVSAPTLLPTFERTGVDEDDVAGPVVTWDQLLRPETPDGFGVVSLVSLDVDDDARFTAVGIVAEPGLVYSSTEALYLSNTNYDFSGNLRETTSLYKFAYEGRGAQVAATGSVPGRVLNQYSMSEYLGNLRVATTIGRTFSFDGGGTESTNNVFVLQQVEDELDVIGQVTGLAPGETIQSARFVGDRGFLVTFEEVDPLFTLDLSEPTDPRVVGELKVPGFSTFIIPMDADHLLTVGRYLPDDGRFFPSGVQLSIFDVSDFANPTLKHNEVISEDGGVFSEALFNPKAFTYFAEEGLIALPVSIYSGGFFLDGADDGVAVEDVFVSEGFDGLIVYEVSTDTGFTEVKRINTRFGENFFRGSFTRGVFISDDAFAVTDVGVRAESLVDPTAAASELMFELPNIDGPFILEPIDVSVPGSSGSGDLVDGGGSATTDGEAIDVLE